MQKATVFYRLPNGNEIIKRDGFIEEELKPIDLISTENCFYISPFNSGNKAYKCYLKNEITKFEIIAYKKSITHYDTEQEFKLKVKRAINTLQNSLNTKKVVLARAKNITVIDDINLNTYFLNLCLNYPNAFVYAVSSSVTGTWVAATPELLFNSDGSQIETVALAGTIAQNENQNWTKKEIDEQRWVEVYIEELIKKHGLDLLIKDGPKDILAGHLKHLYSNYKIKADLQKGVEFLENLNPTPAVCGLPKKEATVIINETENLDRRFYAGFVGVSDKNGIKLFVNLRCMELFKTHANLYAGCGITALSDENKEWNETENKLQSLAKFLP